MQDNTDNIVVGDSPDRSEVGKDDGIIPLTFDEELCRTGDEQDLYYLDKDHECDFLDCLDIL